MPVSTMNAKNATTTKEINEAGSSMTGFALAAMGKSTQPDENDSDPTHDGVA